MHGKTTTNFLEMTPSTGNSTKPKQKNPKRHPRILTGDRPTGKLHLGHYVGTLKNRVSLQDKYDLFIPIVDLHMLTDRIDPTEVKQTAQRIREMVIDYLAVGIDPNKATIFVQSAVPETSELFAILMSLVTISRAERIPTLKEKIRDQKIKHPSMGLLNYPILMAADILGVRAELVPVGKDQESHVELTREIGRKFNSLYSEIFPLPECLIGEIPTLVGLDGKAKMSKSLGNCIYLSDDEETVTKKINGMYTDPKRIHADTPGTVAGNPVFIYHSIFNDNQKEVEDLKSRYQEGRVGDVEVKEKLAKATNKFMDPLRKRRQKFIKQPGIIEKIIQSGNQRAQTEVRKTLRLVKETLGLTF